MSFFKTPEPPTEVKIAEVARFAWLGPPEDMLPGVVPLVLIIARTQDTVVAVSGIRAYPSGFGFTVLIRLRDQAGMDQGLLDYPSFSGGRLRDEVFRFGVRFADGRQATNLDPFPGSEEQPQHPVIVSGGGGGGGRVWDVDRWVWPLPPPGPLTLACAWPARGVPETTMEIQATVILDAAQRVVPLWSATSG